MKPSILAAAFLALLSITSRADLILVEQGVSKAPIVLSSDATPRTREAAATLAAYIEKMSGAKPPILEGAPNPLPPHAIWIGYQPALKPLFPKADFDFQHPEEIFIAANENHLVIAGRDRWDPANMTAENNDGKITGVQQEYGTINAVYTFLQEKLGARWLWPGPLGEDVLTRATIQFAPFEHRHHPAMRSRGGILHYSALGVSGYGRAHEWTKLQRLQLHSMEMEGGHGFGDWWERYHEKYPDIFALQPDGTRSGFPNPRTAKLCASNPTVGKLWLDGVAEQLAKSPTKSVFNASPNDGWASGHCVCANCRAWDHPDGEPRLFLWYKQRETHPALSDRDVTFANRLGQLLKERYPGKDYKILMLSYGHSRPAPIAARPADNVIIMSVANFFGRTGLVDRGSTRGTTYREQFEGWAKITPRLMWRPNTGSPAGWQQGLLDLSIHQTAEDFKAVSKAGCLGTYIDGVWEHWATVGPQLYVMAQLAWNPAQETDAILDDYYTRGFGPAAPAIREYFDTWEKARMAYVAKQGESGIYDFPLLYTAERLATADETLKRADAAVANEPPKYRDRVRFIRAGLTYTQLVIENATLMKGYWKSKDETVATKVRENWKTLEALCQNNPYAINWGPVRSTTPRMAGLHPDQPPPKPKKKAANDLDLN